MANSQKESVRRAHAQLKSQFNDLCVRERELNEAISSPAVAPILARYAKQIEDLKEELTTGEAKTFKGAYDAELEEARRQLAEFESQNSLLIHSTDEYVDDNGEVHEGTNG